MKTRLIEAARSVWAKLNAPYEDDGVELGPRGRGLILSVDVLVEAKCACGSDHIHRLTLASTGECRRCGRTLGIRSIEYYRAGAASLPDPHISVGYVLTDGALQARPSTPGVH